MDPAVTVIIPTYNWSSVLPYSIGSVLRQTFTELEVLVVGDGCTDDSEAVVGRIGDPRVKWINLPTNTGHQSEPNNEGLRQARGQFIAYLGHDDLWLPHHLSCLISALKQGADLAYGMTLYVTGGSDRYDRCLWPPCDYGPDFRIIPPTCVVHRRSVTDHIGGWRHYRELDWYPDLELWLRAYTANYRFACVPRLTAIKFPAVARRDVYKMRPCHEQAAWSQSIQNEDNFEIAELIRTIRALAVQGRPQPIEFTKIASMAPYRVLLHDFLQETRKRLMRRGRRLISRPVRSKANAVEVAHEPKGKVIDVAREFKGLHRMP
jgi:glycosyltransferase involved in cell wall biosynthesis